MKFKPVALALLATAVTIGGAFGAYRAIASDHDDGVSQNKNQNTNLTDLFVFREKDQNPAVTTDDLIFIMNCNPRSLPQNQYYFATDARYEFHVTRISDVNAAATGKEDVLLRYEFSEPDANKQQKVTLTAIRDGETLTSTTTTGNQSIFTTPLGRDPINNTLSIGGQNMTVFAGLREDPFFFDVQRFFQVRASAAKRAGGDTSQPQVTFRQPGEDFTEGYNVLSIVSRIPREFLQGRDSGATTFDVWETVSVRK